MENGDLTYMELKISSNSKYEEINNKENVYAVNI